jgi:hypothetical protein
VLVGAVAFSKRKTDGLGAPAPATIAAAAAD